MEVGRISFSKMYLYENCPTAYKYKYKEKVKVPKPPIMFFGDFLHSFIPRLWNKKTGKIRYATPDSFAEAGLGYSKQWIAGELETRKRKVKFDHLYDITNYEKWARQILIDFYIKNMYLSMPVEMEKRYNFDWKGFELTAKLDRVDERIFNGKKVRIIIDYKLPFPKELKLHRTLQFTLYSLAHEIKYNERAPILWYHLDTGTLHPTQRDEKNYEELYEKLKEFEENIKNDNFPPPNFDNPYCKECEYPIICAERYPDAWSRRKTRDKIKRDFGLFEPEKPLINIDPNIWVKELYGPDFVPKKITEVPIGPRRYTIFGKNLEEAEKAISLSAFDYWSENTKIIKKEKDYILIEAKTRMPKKLRERLQEKGLEVYKKMMEMETIIEKGYNI